MRTVANLIKQLQKFPPDAKAWVYEDVIVVSDPRAKGLPAGHVHCPEHGIKPCKTLLLRDGYRAAPGTNVRKSK